MLLLTYVLLHRDIIEYVSKIRDKMHHNIDKCSVLWVFYDIFIDFIVFIVSFFIVLNDNPSHISRYLSRLGSTLQSPVYFVEETFSAR